MLGYWEERGSKTSLSANFTIKYDFDVSTSPDIKRKSLEYSFISCIFKFIGIMYRINTKFLNLQNKHNHII